MERRRRIPIILAAAIAVSLTVSMALPAAAHHREGHDRGGQGRSEDKGRGKSSGEDEGEGQGQGQSQASGEGQGQGQGQASGKSQGQGKSQNQSHSQASGKSQNQGRPRSAGKSRGQGLRARGTVKIRSTGDKDGDRRNEPHPGCVFWLHLWGFDQGTGTATFRAHPPTGHGELLLSDTVDLGHDQLISGPYDLAPIFESLGISPHPIQGYHVKLTLTSESMRGAGKHKVFWIDCPAAEVIGEQIEAEDGLPPDEVLGEEIAGDEDELALEERGLVPEDDVLGVVHARARPAPQGVRPAAAPEEERAGALPFTGASLLVFLLAALALIGTGAGLNRTRRPQAHDG